MSNGSTDNDDRKPVSAPRDTDDERRLYLLAQDDADALALTLAALRESMNDYGTSRGW